MMSRENILIQTISQYGSNNALSVWTLISYVYKNDKQYMLNIVLDQTKNHNNSMDFFVSGIGKNQTATHCTKLKTMKSTSRKADPSGVIIIQAKTSGILLW